MKSVVTLVALTAFVVLSACNTAVGLARDTYGAGRFVVNQVTDD